MPKILDVIRTDPYGLGLFHHHLLVDEMPVLVFEKNRGLLVATHDGFSQCYEYQTPGPTFKAFGGREFDIPLKDGTVEHAWGQWWDRSPFITKDQGPYTPVGIATLADLQRCYVFAHGVIETAKLNEWLANNEPSTNYYKYRKDMQP
jgi:hypothetical protein